MNPDTKVNTKMKLIAKSFTNAIYIYAEEMIRNPISVILDQFEYFGDIAYDFK